MQSSQNSNVDYDRPVKVAEDIYWVGFYDTESGLHCNPYLIVDGEEAVVIDGGSRPDFPTVMMKILQTGLKPSSIKALIYQHYDPDLCGSIPNFEDIIDCEDLRIISDKANNAFIRHYSVSSPLISLEDLGEKYEFSSGRKLEFIKTPYAHSQGSFITFDIKSGVLFTSDLFGSYSMEWDLFLNLAPDCAECTDYLNCPQGITYCPLTDILKFHQKVMPTKKALSYALNQIEKAPFNIIAPQHGSVINDSASIRIVVRRLQELGGVGIDGIGSE
jgi:flavorubredoxin